MPKQTELTVSYSGLLRANLGNFEHADTHISRSETWDVADIGNDQKLINELYRLRYEALKTEVDVLVEAGYYEALGKEYNPE